jgi:hypothetical protein
MSKGIGICDAGRHLVGLESPTYSKGKFQEKIKSNLISNLILSPEFLALKLPPSLSGSYGRLGISIGNFIEFQVCLHISFRP